MINGRLPKKMEQAISDALQQVGYGQSLIEHNVDFNFIGSSSVYLEPAPLVAFWDKPFDQLTSAIGVRWIPSQEPAARHINALGKYLWVPFSIVARPEHCDIWEVLPTNGLKEPILLEQSVPYDELASRMELRKDRFGREPIRERKLRWRQMSLYELKPSTFFEWAFRPTQKQLKQILNKVLQEGLHNHLDTDVKIKRLRWLLRFTGVRIAWDKGWLTTLSRNSEDELVKAASQYPTPLNPIPEVYELANNFICNTSSISFGIADGGLLSQILQTHGLIGDLRKEWKLYPTPPDIAWRMVETIPIETIPEDKRLIWDGTCGTGTLMVVSMERLRQLSTRPYEDPGQLRKNLIGNDRQPLLVDITRMALDIALRQLECINWTIHTRDVQEYTPNAFDQRPTIIVGNPPFEAKGPGEDFAIHVIDKYIEILEPGGLLSVVLPRTVLGASGRHAVKLREKLLNNFEIFELWELPQGFAPNVSSEVAIICGRKRYAHELQRSAIVWRLFEPHRRTEPLTDVVYSPDVWLQSKGAAIENPLMLRLRAHLKGFLFLSEVIGTRRIALGITPGREGSGDILEEEEPGSRPYLTGRTDMAPFYLPWRKHPRWIRYNSRKLQRSRQQCESLFQERKVLVARRSTGGSPWAVQAAVDEDGLYPSDDFISISPSTQMSCELIAGLFNAAVINFWLRVANPARNIRVGECSAVPIPRSWPAGKLQKVEELAKGLAFLRRELSDGQGDKEPIYKELEIKTLELDEAVYDAYQVPDELRANIGAYLAWYGKSRPGFNTLVIKERELKLPVPSEIFTDNHAVKMRLLFEARRERQLTQAEEKELESLVSRWEQAQILFSRTALKREYPESAHLITLTTESEAY
jgi:hypothetical protein